MRTYLAKIPVFIGLLILLFTIPFTIVLTTQKSPVNPKLKAQEENPSLSIFPQNISTAKIGDELTFTLNIDTKGKLINGLNVRLRYNPYLLRIDQTRSETGTVFDNYPRKIIVDQKNGLVSISAIGNFTGRGVFAKLRVIALSNGTGKIIKEAITSNQVSFDYSGTTITVGD